MADPKVERLRAVPLFVACSDKHLGKIASLADEVDAKPGTVLCREGQSGGDFFIIESGTAELRSSSGVTRTLAAGQFFGEIALLDHGPRTATVTAATPMRLFVLGPAQFRDLIHGDADIAVTLLRTVVQRLRGAAVQPND